MMASPEVSFFTASRGVHPLYNPNDTIVIPLDVVFCDFFASTPILGPTTDIATRCGPRPTVGEIPGLSRIERDLPLGAAGSAAARSVHGGIDSRARQRRVAQTSACRANVGVSPELGHHRPGQSTRHSQNRRRSASLRAASAASRRSRSSRARAVRRDRRSARRSSRRSSRRSGAAASPAPDSVPAPGAAPDSGAAPAARCRADGDFTSDGIRIMPQQCATAGRLRASIDALRQSS